MKYHEAADFLFDLRRFRMKPGTESVRALLSDLGDPQDGETFVQIGGSNGKGSTARMVDAVLREAGYSVGLYTSPHYGDVRERVRVNGRKMPERAVTAFVEVVRPHITARAAAGDPVTFFEALTAMALWEFDRADVDVAVLEVGLGGEYDATSAVDPVASAVTNVSMEHADVLGDSVEAIARTKARIAPAEGPLVTAAEGDALAVVREVAGETIVVGEGDDADVRTTYGGRTNHVESAVSIAGPDWSVETHVPLLGAFQARNAGIAATLARQVGARLDEPVTDPAIVRGLRNAHWPGRVEVMGRDPLVVLDGAHNPDACAKLAAVLDEFEYGDLHLVFGAMNDKDHRGMAESLPTPASVVTCQPNEDRAEDPEVLAAIFESRRPTAEVTAGTSVASALRRVRDRADEDDCVLVAGSLYCVGEARATWTRLAIPKRVRDLGEARETLERAHVSEEGIGHMRGKAVHRVLKTRLERRQAQYLKQQMLALGGECATTALAAEGELLDVVLMGTIRQFRRLATSLDDQPYGLSEVGAELSERLGIGVEAPRRGYPWEDRTAVMGIVNVTPDSFHDGGEFEARDDAVVRAEAMVEAGVDIIDVGGESTRPGAEPVPSDEERARVVPVIERIAGLDALVSVDTRKAEVARAALDAGADLLNDVTGLEDPEMRFLAADRDVPVVVMHSIDAPVVPNKDVEYDDVVEDVIEELRERVLLAEKAGIPRENVIVDPGLGFGKSRTENFAILGRLGEFRALGCPVLVGHSHKSMFGMVSDDSLAATVAGTAIAADRGADIVRVHDVVENAASVNVVRAADDPPSVRKE